MVAGLQAVKSRIPLNLHVRVVGGSKEVIGIDSVTTAKEILEQTCAKLGLASTEGFGIRLETGKCAVSLGQGNAKVLDVVAAHGGDSNAAPACKLVLWKESVDPAHSNADEVLAKDLTAQMVFDAVTRATNKTIAFKDDAEKVDFLVKRYYIEHGDMDSDKLDLFMKSSMPKRWLAKKKSDPGHSADEWMVMIEKGHARAECVKRNHSINDVRQTIIDLATSSWPTLLSLFVPIEKVEGPALSSKPMYMSISTNNLIVCEQGSDKIAKELRELRAPMRTPSLHRVVGRAALARVPCCRGGGGKAGARGARQRTGRAAGVPTEEAR